MIKITRLGILKALSVIMATGALLYCAWAGPLAKEYIGKDILLISPEMNDSRYFFERGDIDTAENAYQGVIIAESLENATISFEQIRVYAKLARTGYEYFSANNLPFVDGEPWIEEREHERVIVLSESLAWMLFGNTKASGESIVLFDKEYIVTGVIRQERVAKDACYAWIPPGDEIHASRIYLKPAEYNKLDSYLNAAELISSMNNKSERDYIITDMNRYVESIGVRYKILFFLIGLYMIYIILRTTLRIFKKSAGTRVRVISAALIAMDLLVITAIAHTISFELWAPAFSGDLTSRLFQAVTNQGLLPPIQYLSSNLAALSRINTGANIAFGVGLAGIFQMFFLL